jgi:hypothetical protein
VLQPVENLREDFVSIFDLANVGEPGLGIGGDV